MFRFQLLSEAYYTSDMIYTCTIIYALYTTTYCMHNAFFDIYRHYRKLSTLLKGTERKGTEWKEAQEGPKRREQRTKEGRQSGPSRVCCFRLFGPFLVALLASVVFPGCVVLAFLVLPVWAVSLLFEHFLPKGHPISSRIWIPRNLNVSCRCDACFRPWKDTTIAMVVAQSPAVFNGKLIFQSCFQFPLPSRSTAQVFNSLLFGTSYNLNIRPVRRLSIQIYSTKILRKARGQSIP